MHPVVNLTIPALSYDNSTVVRHVRTHFQSATSLDHSQHDTSQSSLSSPRHNNELESYQTYMTINAESGPVIIPLEIGSQKASKIADEMRKLSAGALAKFRARRRKKD